ncbi:MAG: hypothetical protein ABIS38_06825 [Sphingomicrobium sp.]
MSQADVHDALQPAMNAIVAHDDLRIQAGGYLLELSPDWIVRRASQNIQSFLGKSHVTMIDEPFGHFVQAQALHDLRNHFSRLSGTTGVARAYGVRLTHEHDRFDLAFQLSDSRVLLEATPTSGDWVGQALGTVGGLVAGLAGLGGQTLLDAAARRMRALTGYDRVTLTWGGERAESSRGGFAAPARALRELPAIVADCAGETVALFPQRRGAQAIAVALLRAPSDSVRTGLGEQDVRAALRLPFTAAGQDGEFRADSRIPRAPSFELHAAAELFAQMFAMRAEVGGAA